MKSNENYREGMKSLTANRRFAPPLSFLRWAVCSLVLALAAMPLHAQFTFTDWYDFDSATGSMPFNYGTLAVGSDARLYGTTYYGGTHNQGVLFATTTLGVYAPLFDFGGLNGGAPLGGLTVFHDLSTNPPQDYFYGVTTAGGKNDLGTVFRYNATTGIYKVLHSFTATENDADDGAFAEAPPVFAADGNLYGVTGLGRIFSIKRPNDSYHLLSGSAGGTVTAPLSPVTEYSPTDTDLWGVSIDGGQNGYGSVFKVTILPAGMAGTVTTVYSFTGGNDGAYPGGPLTIDAGGTLYGTASAAGLNGNGVIFTIGVNSPYTFSNPPLYTFDAGFHNTDGSWPVAGLTPAGGNLYLGANEGGGTYGNGTLFDVTSTGTFTPLFELQEGLPPSGDPTTTLIQFGDGNFYGLMSGGPGTPGAGTFYSLNPPNPYRNITWCCNTNLILDQPVMILGLGLEGAVQVTFGGAQAQFQPGSDTYLIADVPSEALDGPLAVVLATGEQVQSVQSAHILPTILNLDPSSGPVGTTVVIAGGGFAGTTMVKFGSTQATNFTVLSPALIQVVVPEGAKTGKVEVTTPNGTALSPENFKVIK
jgi:uncharacterized repeat protein (TIGR03803 family)